MAGECVVTTAMLWGMEARPVKVEVSFSGGLPNISIVGRPDAAVGEARSRVRCAIKAAGFEVPRQNVTVNLAPAEQRKTGTAFDLPIAVAILAAARQIPTAGLEGCLIVGELALNGEVCSVRGLAAYAKLAKELGLRLIAPFGQIDGCGDVSDVRFVVALQQFREPVGSIGQAPPLQATSAPIGGYERDFGDIAGQEMAKRALSIAVSGHLGILLVGPPGVGKTMLASCVPGILPDMTEEEYGQTVLVHSVAGSDDPRVAARLRPFRAPHHSTGSAGLLGGGRPVRPGEVSLAHNGVLFLDELGEYNRMVLQSLRQPMEERVVRVTRVDGTYTFPCDFQLVAASNPCPCGHLGDPATPCTCTPAAVQTYRSKLAGPLVDRIDLVVSLDRPNLTELLEESRGSTTEQMRARVLTARAFAAWRAARRKEVPVGNISPKGGRVVRVLECYEVSAPARRLFESMAATQNLSVRALVSVLKTARVVADMEESAEVLEDHLLESLGYRDREVIG